MFLEASVCRGGGGGGTQRHRASLWPGFEKDHEGAGGQGWHRPPRPTGAIDGGIEQALPHRSHSVSAVQHGTLGSGRSSDKGPSWSSRSLGARCRNSIASCPEEQPHVGNYRLLRTIGKGNFAKVKLARHILTGREVSGGP